MLRGQTDPTPTRPPVSFLPSRPSRVRFGLLVAALALLSGADRAVNEQRSFWIPAGKAADTLLIYAEQADVQIFYDFAALADVQTQAIAGSLDARTALSMMLGRSAQSEFLVAQRGHRPTVVLHAINK